jgi:hypothetical protein
MRSKPRPQVVLPTSAAAVPNDGHVRVPLKYQVHNPIIICQPRQRRNNRVNDFRHSTSSDNPITPV